MARNHQAEEAMEKFLLEEREYLASKVVLGKSAHFDCADIISDLLVHVGSIPAMVHKKSRGVSVRRFGDLEDISLRLVRECCILTLEVIAAYAEKEENLGQCVSFLEKLIRTVCYPIVRTALEPELRKYQERHASFRWKQEVSRLRSVCWVCKRSSSEPKCADKVVMCKGESYAFRGPAISWKTIAIGIPRCPLCAQKESAERTRLRTSFDNAERQRMRIEASWSFQFFKTKSSLSCHESVVREIADIKLALGRLNHYDYPEISHMLQQGWEIGEKPRTRYTMGYNAYEDASRWDCVRRNGI